VARPGSAPLSRYLTLLELPRALWKRRLRRRTLSDALAAQLRALGGNGEVREFGHDQPIPGRSPVHSLVVYEANSPTGLIDAVAMLVLGLASARRTEGVRVFFGVGGWSWTITSKPVASPRGRSGRAPFPIRDVAGALGRWS
jgi:hypothetical protein